MMVMIMIIDRNRLIYVYPYFSPHEKSILPYIQSTMYIPLFLASQKDRKGT